MGSGGKTGTTTQQLTIPPAVLRNYNYAWRMARDAAKQPFQEYGGEFVAPINERQTQAMQGIDLARGVADPYYRQAGQMTLGAAGPVQMGELGQTQIEKYLNPYTQNVVDTTMKAQAQQNQQQYNQLYGNAITQGAFGGDRAGVGAANLAYQQNLANQQQIADLYRTGYTQALGVASEQQMRDLQARQQDQARALSAAQQYGQLGTGAQEAALQGFQAQLGAGTLQQQTQQALDAALYQQFLQKKGYPFQTAQFLANIALGLGTASGSTQTTTQPMSFFSDERMKEGVEPIGETFDGQTIYKYRYKGEPQTQIGLIAQEVERHHPEAVGEAGGMKTVNYDNATKDAADRGHFYRGGLVSEGGAVHRGSAGLGYAYGGSPIGGDLAAILESHRGMYPALSGQGAMGQGSPYGGQGGPYGLSLGELNRYEVMRPGDLPAQQESGLSQALDMGSSIANIYKGFSGTPEKPKETGDTGQPTHQQTPQGATTTTTTPVAATTGEPTPAAKPVDDRNVFERGVDSLKSDIKAGYDYLTDLVNSKAHGGLVGYAHGGRLAYAGGGVLPYSTPNSYVPQSILEDKPQQQEVQKPASPPAQGQSDFQNLLGTAGSIAGIYAAFGGSDRRMKEDIKPVGKTYDGQTVYSFKYKGEPATRMGLMAQEVEHDHPEAVAHDHRGLKYVNYEAATRDAGERGKFYAGGLARHGYQTDGAVTDDPMEAALQAQIDADRKRGLAPFEMPRAAPRPPTGPSALQPPVGMGEQSGLGIPLSAYNAGSAAAAERARLQARSEGVNRIPQNELPDFARPVGGAFDQSMAPNVSYGIPESPYGKSPARQGLEAAADTLADVGRFTGRAGALGARGLGFLQSVPFMNETERRDALNKLTEQGTEFGRQYGLVRDQNAPAETTPSLTSALINPKSVPNAGLVGGVNLPSASEIADAWRNAPTAESTPAAETPAAAATGVAPPAAAPTTTAPAAPAPTGLAPAADTARRLSYTDATLRREGGDYNYFPDPQREPDKTAAGAHGITRSTWNDIAPGIGLPSYDEYWANPQRDPRMQDAVFAKLNESNAKTLQNMGLPANDQTMASAHVFGPAFTQSINTLPKETSIEVAIAALPEAFREGTRQTLRDLGNPRTVGEALERQAQMWPTRSMAASRPANAPRISAPAPSMSPEMQGAVDKVISAGTKTPTAQPIPEVLSSRGTWFERNQDWLIPVLSGLGTMASSNSRFLGSAILQGIAGGAAAYPQMQQMQEQLQGQRLENQKRFTELANSDFFTASGRDMVRLANGDSVRYGDWVAMGQPPTAHQMQFLNSLGTPPEVLADLEKRAPPEPEPRGAVTPDVVDAIQQNASENMRRPVAALDEIDAKNREILRSNAAQAEAARASMVETRKMLDIIANADPKDLGPTVWPKFYTALAANLNAAVRPYTGEPIVDESGAVNRQVLEKLNRSAAFQNAGRFEQNNVEGLLAAIQSNPGPDMYPAASFSILATQLVEAKRALDMNNFARDAASVASGLGDPRAFDMSITSDLFRRAHPDTDYKVAEDILKKMVSRPEGAKMFADFIHGRHSRAEIDEAFTRQGLPPMGAIFMGGE